MKYNVRILIVFLLALFFSCSGLQSQSLENEKKNNRWFTGGGIGFQFGTITAFEISPRVGYMITNKWAAGVGGTYIYYKNKKYISDGSKWHSIERNIFGGSIFSRYFVYNNFFAHVEYEILTLEKFILAFDPVRIESDGWATIHSPFVGGGYRQPLGNKAFFNIMVLFNLNETLDSPYSNPVIRMGFGFGF